MGGSLFENHDVGGVRMWALHLACNIEHRLTLLNTLVLTDLIFPVRLLHYNIPEFLFHQKINTSNVDLRSACQEKEQVCKNLP